MTQAWPQAVLFDLDGTLIDSLPDIAAALARLFGEEGLPPLLLEEVRPLVGDGAGVLVARAFERAGAERPADAFARFVSLYGEAVCVETRLYPGVAETLRALDAAGCKLAVATNKPEALARAILGELGIGALFRSVAGGDSYSERKPHPDHLLNLLRDLEAAPAYAVMVGDSANDLQAARAAGLPVVLCRYGYSRDPVDGLGAERVIETFADLPAALVGLR